MNKKAVAFIFAKGSSKRLPKKNLNLLGGETLLERCVEKCFAAKCFDRVIVSSDSEEIIKKGQRLGAFGMKRPKYLCDNTATGDDLMVYAAENSADCGIIAQVCCTAPFLRSSVIREAVHYLKDSYRYKGAVAVRQEPLYEWKYGIPIYYSGGIIPNSFEMNRVVYETTGLYVARRSAVLEYRKRVFEGKTKLLAVGRIEAFDINDFSDMDEARKIWEGLKK